MAEGNVAQAVGSLGVEAMKSSTLSIYVQRTRGLRLRLTFGDSEDVKGEWCYDPVVFSRRFPCLRSATAVPVLSVFLDTDDANLVGCLCQTLVERTLPKNRIIGWLNAESGAVLSIFRKAQVRIKNLELRSFMPTHVPHLVAFLEVYSHRMETLDVTFHEPQPGRANLFDERANLSHLWRGIAGSQLTTFNLNLRFSVPNPSMNLDVDDLGAIPCLKHLFIFVTRVPSSDAQPQEDEESFVAATVTKFHRGVLKLYLSCKSLEMFCLHHAGSVSVLHSMRKDVFLDYCEAIATSRTGNYVGLPSPSLWWQDDECIDAVLRMVRINRQLKTFRLYYSHGSESSQEHEKAVSQARYQIDFWLWVNVNVNEEKLVNGTTPPCLWPFLLERLMTSEDETQATGTITWKRTLCNHLLRQRIDLVGY